MLREQDLPQLRAEIEKMSRQVQDLKAKVDNLSTLSKRNLSSETDTQGYASNFAVD